MKMRRMLSILMMICLLVCLAVPSAIAAPARDKQLEEVTVDLGLQTLVEMAMEAAVLSDVSALETDIQPEQALTEGMLAVGLYRYILPYEGAQTENTPPSALTHAQAEALYQMVFTSGAYTAPVQTALPFASLEKDGLRFDYAAFDQNPVIGAYIYSAAFDGVHVTLLCDLYEYFDLPGQSAETLPEEALIWLCQGEISLTYAPESFFGYTLDGFTLSPVYLNGQLSAWQPIDNMEYEYSFNLPSMLGLAGNDPQAMAWQSADGTVDLRIEVSEEALSYDETLSRFMLNHPGQTVTEQKEFSQFYAVGEGIYSLVIVPEELPWAYTLTLSFPAERQAEFTLYAEFIRNSMIVWGLSNG